MNDNPEPSYRTSESERFTPTLKQDVSDNALIGLGILVFVPLILWVRRGYRSSWSWTFALAGGAVGAFLAFLFYTCRFLLRAPRSVRFSDTALILELRNGRESEIHWSDVRRARSSSYGEHSWRLWTDDSVFNVRDGGFSAVQWQKISNHILKQLTEREIPISIVSEWGKATELDLANAQNTLGLCYDTGDGVAKDPVEAAKWYRKAAEQNHANAQYNLSVCYDNAEGVAKDYVEAYKWRLLAARQGNENAKKAMTMLENKMTPEQIAEGQKLAESA
jgi:hypothetical protein